MQPFWMKFKISSLSRNGLIEHFWKSFLSRNAVYGFPHLVHSKPRLAASFIEASTFLSLEKQSPSWTSESDSHLNGKSVTQIGIFNFETGICSGLWSKKFLINNHRQNILLLMLTFQKYFLAFCSNIRCSKIDLINILHSLKFVTRKGEEQLIVLSWM